MPTATDRGFCRGALPAAQPLAKRQCTRQHNKKDLRGVTRRFAFFVPNHGPDAVRRPVLGCHTLEGSKPLRQFVDCKSDSAQILTRLHSCHECEGCRTLSDYRIELDDDGNATIRRT